jgi:hypothetical protein
MWQAIISNGVVVNINNWETEIGIPCDETVQIGDLWDGEKFISKVNPRTWAPLTFLELFNPQKQLAVKQASMANAQIGLWYDKLLASSQVIENDPRLIEGLAFLVQAGILTQSDIDLALTNKG